MVAVSAEEAWTRGRAAHPGVEVPRETFAVYLAERPDAGGALAERAVDLYLACACSFAVPGAAQVFDRRFLTHVGDYLGSRARDADFIAEVRQLLRIRFLVGDDRRAPRILDYRGAGSLDGWVRVAACRMALDLARASGRREALAGVVGASMVAEDGELAFIKERYREPIRAAFAAALSGLSREHRTCIRLHYLEKLTTAELATFFKVSRATSIRRVRQAREALLDAVAAEARARLAIGPDELEPLLGLMRSQLDVSVARLLAETSGA